MKKRDKQKSKANANKNLVNFCYCWVGTLFLIQITLQLQKVAAFITAFCNLGKIFTKVRKFGSEAIIAE